MKTTWIAMALPIALLAACGGGGDDAPVAPPAPAPAPAPQLTTTNPQAALKGLLTQTRSYSLSGGASNGTVYTLAFSLAPSGTYTFSNGASFPTTRITSQLSGGGALVSVAFADYVYDSQDGRVLRINYGDGACGVLSTSSAPPTSAAVGAVGTMFAGQKAGGCLTFGAISNITATWSVEMDGVNLMACMNLQTRFLAVAQTEAYCFAVNSDGVLQSAARISLNNGEGFSMTLR